jgi:WhiB family redox-sensing transcriptional regulator
MAMSFCVPSDRDDTGWRNRAACRDSDPNLFFPVGSTGVALEEVQAAKALCRTCPVRAECLAFALETNQEAGVWGGASEEERRQLRRNRHSARRPAPVRS